MKLVVRKFSELVSKIPTLKDTQHDNVILFLNA